MNVFLGPFLKARPNDNTGLLQPVGPEWGPPCGFHRSTVLGCHSIFRRAILDLRTKFRCSTSHGPAGQYCRADNACSAPSNRVSYVRCGQGRRNRSAKDGNSDGLLSGATQTSFGWIDAPLRRSLWRPVFWRRLLGGCSITPHC